MTAKGPTISVLEDQETVLIGALNRSDDRFQTQSPQVTGHAIGEGARPVRLVDHAGRCDRTPVGPILRFGGRFGDEWRFSPSSDDGALAGRAIGAATATAVPPTGSSLRRACKSLRPVQARPTGAAPRPMRPACRLAAPTERPANVILPTPSACRAGNGGPAPPPVGGKGTRRPSAIGRHAPFQ